MFASSKTLKGLQKRLFQLFVFLLPTQLALHLWPDWALVFGIRVDYLSPAIYLTDIVLVFLIFFWLISRPKLKDYGLKKKAVFLIALLTIFAVINTLLAHVPQAAFYKWVKLFVFSFLLLFIAQSKNFKKEIWLEKPLKYSLIVFSTIGIIQFFLQRTIGGPFYYLGERSFDYLTPGIAVFDLFGRRFLRAYSTFSHPNSFGAFLVASLALLYSKKKGFLKLDYLVLATSLVALILSFSRASLFVLITLIIIRFAGERWKFEKRIFTSVLTLGILGSLLTPLVTVSLLKNYDFQESIAMRLSLARGSGELFTKRPVTGIGLNNFVVNLPNTSISPSYSWDLQPAHNIFLLTLSETGLIGLIFLYFVLRRAFNLASKDVKYGLAAVVLTGIVDHHWLTLQQNLLFLFVIFGLSFSSRRGK